MYFLKVSTFTYVIVVRSLLTGYDDGRFPYENEPDNLTDADLDGLGSGSVSRAKKQPYSDINNTINCYSKYQSCIAQIHVNLCIKMSATCINVM